MKNKIELLKEELIVFMGSMNAMPMMYAWELRKKGYNVIYFVDAPVSDSLSRPENHFVDIDYPYPNWIIELKLPTQMLLPFFPKIFAKKLIKIIKSRSDKIINCIILNGLFVSLAPWLKSQGRIIALSHGSDLDVWANRDNYNNLANLFCSRSIFKFFPKLISKKLIKFAVFKQYDGFSVLNSLIYFPRGFNKSGDIIVKSLKKEGVNIFERYDISFEPLNGISRIFKKNEDKLIIFSGVRFLYKTFPEGNRDYSKGNDLIIRGIALYKNRNKNIEVHFVEKGEDVIHAKNLCKELGLNEVIIWHKEMPFKELINIYLKSDICFDQLGAHWMGAIGAYALYLGKPLIANVNRATELGVFPIKNPILSVKDEFEVFNALVELENNEFRFETSNASKKFVEAEMGCEKLLNQIFYLN